MTTRAQIISPRKLLLVDAFGALLTSALTGGVFGLGWLPSGLPQDWLLGLAGIAALFFLISSGGYFFATRPGPVLRFMAGANLTYGTLALLLCAKHWASLTAWSWVYFPTEFILILFLSEYEWKSATRSAV